MKGHVLLSHGLESGPHATKVTAMAAQAERLGWRSTRPDFRDLDASGDPARIADRVDRLLSHARAGEPLVLAGSSMGAFASALASRKVACKGLFLVAPPLAIPGFAADFDPEQVPTELVHGWHDELIPADRVIAFAAGRSLPLHLLDDSHRLAGHVDRVAALFGLFLEGLA